MTKPNTAKATESISDVPLPNVDLLQRREPKSVRTTINISLDTANLIKWLKEKQGMTPRGALDAVLGSEDLLRVMLLATDGAKPARASQTIRKSVVLSSPALRNLNGIAKQHGKSRDSLISTAIQLVKVLIEKQNKETREKHGQAIDIVGKAWSQIDAVEIELISVLGGNDPIISRWGFVVVLAMNLYSAIQSELEEGLPIDPDDFSQTN